MNMIMHVVNQVKKKPTLYGSSREYQVSIKASYPLSVLLVAKLVTMNQSDMKRGRKITTLKKDSRKLKTTEERIRRGIFMFKKRAP